MAENTHRNLDVDEDERDDEDFDPQQYDKMLTLERLESLEEDMVELAVQTLEEVRQRILELHHELDADE
jgi:hypothetical protein